MARARQPGYHDDAGVLKPLPLNVLNANESNIRVFQDVLAEVMELFPSKFIHVGGDEVRKDEWKVSAAAQARMRELGLKNEDELQSYFIRRMDQFLASRGRRLVGWDEILEGGLAPGATVMSWRGIQGGIAAARAGHDVVMAHTIAPTSTTTSRRTPKNPWPSAATPLEKVYQYEPIPPDLSAPTPPAFSAPRGNCGRNTSAPPFNSSTWRSPGSGAGRSGLDPRGAKRLPPP